MAIMRFALVAAVLVIGCGRGLPAEDATDVENAAVSSALAYKYLDADSNAAILICATHRSVQAVIRDQKLAPVDAGIPCQ